MLTDKELTALQAAEPAARSRLKSALAKVVAKNAAVVAARQAHASAMAEYVAAKAKEVGDVLGPLQVERIRIAKEKEGGK